jgi:hypothetical protein
MRPGDRAGVLRLKGERPPEGAALTSEQTAGVPYELGC